MKTMRLRWVLYPSYLFIALLTLVPLAWFVSSTVETFHVKQTKDNLEIFARLIAGDISERNLSAEQEEINSLCEKLGEKINGRITITDSQGRVVGDSAEDPSRMDNHGQRPEIMQAMRGETGVSMRASDTVGVKLLYVGVPLISAGRITGVVRAAIPLTSLDATVRRINRDIFSAGIVIALAAIVASFGLARILSAPLETLKTAVEHFAKGESNVTVIPEGVEETKALALAFNKMAKELQEKIRGIVQERNERDALFAGMTEGVIAVDNNECVRHLNRTAKKLLGIESNDFKGKPIQEIVRNSAFLSFVTEALTAGKPIEADIELGSMDKTHIQCRAAVLKDSTEQRTGIIIVMNDITKLRRLEQMRRDFVANVSHEIRTPLTSIKGFAETLIDETPDDPEEVKRFLKIVRKHVDHLSALVDDLMTLARLEHDTETRPVAVKQESLESIIREAVDVCSVAAASKKTGLSIECAEKIETHCNALLLRQALVNLIDNAIKYSPPGSDIKIKMAKKENNAIIGVIDNGPGIEQKHVDRIFERFYRVDKSRSRRMGGTGLGLAIVKHIILAHNGTTTAQSTPGKGSVFSIHLPL